MGARLHASRAPIVQGGRLRHRRSGVTWKSTPRPAPLRPCRCHVPGANSRGRRDRGDFPRASSASLRARCQNYLRSEEPGLPLTACSEPGEIGAALHAVALASAGDEIVIDAGGYCRRRCCTGSSCRACLLALEAAQSYIHRSPRGESTISLRAPISSTSSRR